MKKQIAIIAALFIVVTLSTSFAQAGAARRHTIEGFLLGTGVTLLGTAIAHSINKPGPVVVHTTPRHHEYRYDKRHKKHRRGHWETRKIWIDPVYETRWNPGHYNKRGKWVSGRHKKFLVAQGYWAQAQVRIRRHQ